MAADDPDHKVVVRRRFPATREELFDAWTDRLELDLSPIVEAFVSPK